MAKVAKPLETLDLSVAQVLAEKMLLLGVSQNQMAALTGISRNRIGIILKGQRPASVGEVDRMVTHLGTVTSAVVREAEERLGIAIPWTTVTPDNVHVLRPLPVVEALEPYA